MTDLVVTNGWILTQNDRCQVIPNGAVAVADGEITHVGPAAIGRAEDLGSLGVGKRADTVIVPFDGPHAVPSSDPVRTLVYGSNAGDVRTVIIDGEVMMDDGDLETVVDDPEALYAEVRETAAEVVERAEVV
jgi:5-methylthioadenosine/S-adenosylhomocysteine deaminase